MPVPPQIAWMLGAATGCIVSTAGMNLVFRNPKTGVVRECSVEEITSLEKLDASEIDITKLGKEVPTDDLELYMRYQREGSIEHFTDGEKKTISRIETMGIKGDECEEILRARGREVNRPPIEEPEVVLPPRNESGSNTNKLFKNQALLDEHYGKHGQEIADVLGDSNYSIDKYLDDANYIINNGTYVPELNGYVSFMSGKKYGFVGLDRTTGDITTFHIKNISELIKKAPSLGFER